MEPQEPTPSEDILEKILATNDIGSLLTALKNEPYVGNTLGENGARLLFTFLINLTVFPLDAADINPGQDIEMVAKIFMPSLKGIDDTVARAQFNLALECSLKMKLITKLDSKETERIRMNEDLWALVNGLFWSSLSDSTTPST